jgi:RimJ/RimL family protein N-acetyltransferase
VTIRPIRPDDGERLRLSHERLSPDARYRRFMSAKPHLSSSDARYLVDVDGEDHYALVATADEDGDEQIVAVARFIRLPEDPDVAEFAIVVGDRWQRQGLAFELLRRLADAADPRGVQRFRATMLADNAPIHRLVERFAAGDVDHRRQGTTCEAEFSVHPHHDDRRAAPEMIVACAGS